MEPAGSVRAEQSVLLYGICNFSFLYDEITILFEHNECEQIGVSNNKSYDGSTIGSPADIL